MFNKSDNCGVEECKLEVVVDVPLGGIGRLKLCEEHNKEFHILMINMFKEFTKKRGAIVTSNNESQDKEE